MDTCVFCGRQGDDFDPEHWVPEWLNRKLFPEYGTGVRHNLPDKSWDADAFELTCEHVCTDCNRHFLSNIESKAARFVFPLVMGTPNKETISADGLRHVARWGYLKTISLELTRPPDHVPTHDVSVYENFRRTKWPPLPGCSLALGVRDIGPEEHQPVFLWFQSQGGHSYTGSPPHSEFTTEGYRTTLLVGHVVFDVIGLRDPGELPPDIHGDAYVPLWPDPAARGGRFTWPPRRRFRWREGLELD